jgi:hypothetical protein
MQVNFLQAPGRKTERVRPYRVLCRCHQDVYVAVGLATETAGFANVSTHFLDTGHHPALLRQRRQGYLIAKNICGADGCIVRRTLCGDLFPERRSTGEVVKEPAVELGLVDPKRK